MDQLLADVRYSIRSLANRPGFTAVAVLTLALAIGATTAVFSVVSAVLLRDLPYGEPDRIVQVWNPWSNEPGVTRGRSPLAPLDVADARDAVESFERMAAYQPPQSVNLTGAESPERVFVTRATADLFAVLDVRPALGRAFTAAEDAPGENNVVVLSHELWRSRFGANRGVLEQEVRLDGVPHRVVGVMPRGFQLPEDLRSGEGTDLWKPLGLDTANLDRGTSYLRALARLKPGASVERANAELAALTRWWIDQGFKIRDLAPYYAVPIEEELLGAVRPALLLLSGAVGFVLLIACVNVAALMLARSDGRAAEIALRSALGAGRWRIGVQLLVESLVLAAAGGAVGILFALVGVRALVALDPAAIPRFDDVRLDPATLAFAAIVSLAAAMIFGLAPALRAGRADVVADLKSAGRSGGGGRQRVRGLLVAGQVALSVVLVIGAALMVRTVVSLMRVDLGFDSTRVLTFNVSLPALEYPDAADRAVFHTQLAERLQSLPGAQAAGAARFLPLTTRLGGGATMIEGAPPPRPGEGPPNTRWQIVTPGYFDAMRYVPVAGRLLDARDRAGALPVVVVNETMARQFWPDSTAIGRRVRTPNRDVPWFTIVGVVADERHAGVVSTPSPTMYIPLEQVPLTRTFTPTVMAFAVRTEGDPLALAGAVREAVRAMNPNLPVSGLRPMDAIVGDALAAPRFTTLLLALFAAVALALAAVGLYGLLAYSVAQRRREIGIRVALGARRSSVLGLVMWRGARLALAGLAAGLIAARSLAPLIESQLYQVEPLDPAAFGLVPLVFAVVCLVATYVPARRAASVDPIIALKQE